MSAAGFLPEVESHNLIMGSYSFTPDYEQEIKELRERIETLEAEMHALKAAQRKSGWRRLLRK